LTENNENFLIEDDIVDADIFADDGMYDDDDFDSIESGGASGLGLLKIQDVMDIDAYADDARGRKTSKDVSLKDCIRKTYSFDRRQVRYVRAIAKGTDWASNWNRLQLVTLTGRRPTKTVKGRVVTLKKMEAIITEVQAETMEVVNRFTVNLTPDTFRKYARDLDVLVSYLEKSRPGLGVTVESLTVADSKVRELVAAGTLPLKRLED
jgi:hypothetical protein